MQKSFILFTLLTISIFAQYWDSQFDINLTKDEVKEFQILDPTRQKSFSFRWTLYINNGLVVLANYDGYPYQFILYKDYNRNSFKIELYRKRAFLFVEFDKFNLNNREAKFKVMFKNSSAEEIKKDGEW
jgi:hypothetical protein